VPVIYYTKASHHLLPAVVRAGANVLSVDWRIPLAEVRKNGRPARGPAGDLDPPIFVCPAEKIRQATLDIAAELSGHGHILILATGFLQTRRGKCAVVHSHRPASRASSSAAGGANRR